MKLSPAARKLKKAILAEYEITDQAGLAILETALQAYDGMNAAQEIVKKDGLTLGGDRGSIKAHPLCAVIRDCRAQFLMAMKHLNLDLEPLKDRPGRPSGGK
jgi:P27 family predicted phage terminase small subunit